MQSSFHFLINFGHPDFDWTVFRLDEFLERESLIFIRLHTLNLFAFGHDELFTVVKQFEHVGLDSLRV
jgi:hypothetical protein